MMPYNTYDTHTRPHMDQLSREAAQHQLASRLQTPLRVQVGLVLTRIGERLLRGQRVQTAGYLETGVHTAVQG